MEQENPRQVISVIYISNRPGSLDILTHALSLQTFRDWELVFVDGLEGRIGRGFARAHLDKHDCQVGWHGDPKPKTFPWSRTGFVNAMNTGLIHARGSHAVFLHDFTHIPPDALGLWAKGFETYPKALLHGVAGVYKAPPPDGLNDVTTWSDPPPLTFQENWIPGPPAGVFEVGYWGGPMEFFEACNGIDERADFRASWALNDVIAKARAHGYDLLVVRDLVCSQINHRLWQEKFGDTIYRTIDEYQDAPTEPVWTRWACNPYNLRDERRRALEETP